MKLPSNSTHSTQVSGICLEMKQNPFILSDILEVYWLRHNARHLKLLSGLSLNFYLVPKEIEYKFSCSQLLIDLVSCGLAHVPWRGAFVRSQACPVPIWCCYRLLWCHHPYHKQEHLCWGMGKNYMCSKTWKYFLKSGENQSVKVMQISAFLSQVSFLTNCSMNILLPLLNRIEGQVMQVKVYINLNVINDPLNKHLTWNKLVSNLPLICLH